MFVFRDPAGRARLGPRLAAHLFALLVTTACLSAPALASGPLTSGATVPGVIAGPGFSETWTFSGTVGDRILLSAVTTSGGLNTLIRLRTPGSVEVVNTTADRVDYQLTATGTYTLFIDDSGLNDAGNYNLTFLDLTAGPLTSGADTDGGATASALVKTGQFNSASDLDAFTFTGTAGDRILISGFLTGGTANTTLTLYPPGGGAAETSTGTADRMDWQLVRTGTYTVVIEDGTDAFTGTYSLCLLNLTAGPLTSGPDPDGGTIASTELKTGQMTTAGDFDAYRFTAQGGNRILLEAITTSGSMNTLVSIYPSTGAAAISTSADRLEYQVPADGTYTIVVEDLGLNDTGNYSLSMLNLSGALTSAGDLDGGLIVSGTVRTGQFNVAPDFDAYTFSGTIGDHVLLSAFATGGTANTTMTLYPQGGGAAETSTGSADRMDWTLNATGIYTVVVEDYAGTQTGTYSLSFLNLTQGPLTSGPDPDGGTIASAEVKTGSMQTVGDFDAYMITVNAGNRILLEATTTSGAMNTNVSVYSSTGVAVVSTSADRSEFQATLTGTYTIVIEDLGLNDLGSYSLTMLNLAGPLTSGPDPDGGAIVSAQVKTGQFNTTPDFDAYTFTGTVGDRILASAFETGGSANTTLALYGPTGGAAETSTGSADRLDWTLAATGTYTLVVEDYSGAQLGTYSLSFLNLTAGPLTSGPDPDGGPIASAEVKTGSMQTVGDFDAFTFTASAGNRFLLGAITTNGAMNTNLSIYPVSGGPALTGGSGDRQEFLAPATGSYRIVVEDLGLNDTGNYSLSLINLAGPLSNGTDPDGGAIASAEVRTGQFNAAPDFDAYTFSGTVGDHILASAFLTGGNANTTMNLYPPGGGPVEVSTNTVDRLDWTLAATGTYTLVVEDYTITQAGTYSLSLLNLTAGPLTSVPDPDGGTIVSGEVRTGTAQTVGDFDAYRVTLTAGSRVLVSSITTSGLMNTNTSVYPPTGPSIAGASGDRTEFQAPVSGTYSIVIEDLGLNDTGDYSLSLLDMGGKLTTAADLNGGPIVSSEVKTGALSTTPDFDAYTFYGAAGEHVLVGALATSGTGNTTLALYPPGGGPAETFTSGGDRLDWTLLNSGKYTIVVEAISNNLTCNYTLTFLNLNGAQTLPPDADGGTVVYGAVRAAQMNTAPDFDGFQFIGAVGDTVHIAAVTTSGLLNTNVSLYPPVGPAVVSTVTDNVNFVLTSPGIHTIVIEDQGLNDTGGYNLTVTKSGAVVGVGDLLATTLRLAPPRPNPFASEANFQFSLPRELPVRLRVFDVSGALVRTVASGTLPAGTHSYRWDGRDENGAGTASGIYYVELAAGTESVRRKIVRMR